jgi:hypothetical protein
MGEHRKLAAILVTDGAVGYSRLAESCFDPWVRLMRVIPPKFRETIVPSMLGRTVDHRSGRNLRRRGP